MLDACARSPGCNAAHPDLGGKLDATLAALPLPDSGPHGGPLTRALFAAALVTIQGRDVNAVDDVPAFVDRAHDDIVKVGALSGETRSLLSQAWNTQAPPTLAMYYSVTCSDNQHADSSLTTSSLARVRPGFVDYFKGTSDLAYAACQGWPVRPVAAEQFGAVQSSVPTLLLNARYDTLTPASWAEATAQTLSRSTLVEITRAAHITVGSNDTGCAFRLASRFFDSPSTGLDASCAQ
jgi:pimeloyl-ACP methyl ester carboxylesterase